MADGRLRFLCLQPQEVMAAVVAAVVGVLRPNITMVWIDANY